MAYDTTRSRAVLVGGDDGSGVRNDTWEWDGSQWQQVQTLTSPTLPQDEGAAGVAVFNSARNRTQYFFGTEYEKIVWEYDGSTWSRAGNFDPYSYRWCPMAFDPGRGVGTMFSGGDPLANLTEWRDTWEWAGRWIRRHPTTTPPGRVWHALTADWFRGRTVLFGGFSLSSGQVYGDTWEWNGANWNRANVPGPSPRDGVALEFYPPGGYCLLAGGGFDETWTWNGAAWNQLSPAHSPGTRWSPSLAFDAHRNRLVLFGGTNGQRLNDTWEWDGADWRATAPTQSPSARFGAGLTYDYHRRVCVLASGDTGAGYFWTDTWEYDGVTWRQRYMREPMGGRWSPGLFYDPVRRECMLFGGMLVRNNGDGQRVWFYGPTLPARFDVYGQGCGTPVLRGRDGDLPWQEDVLQVELVAPPTNLAVIALGWSDQVFAGQSLPLPLGPGAPGCALLAALDYVVLATDQGGWVGQSLAIPRSNALRGVRFYQQAAVLDPGANPAGLAVSNGVAGIVGVK